MSSNVIDPPALPYNPINRAISEADVNRMLSKYGVHKGVKSVSIYRNAMVHRSYCTRKNENFVNGNTQCPGDCVPLQEESNERLEFLGDAVINLTIAKYLFDRYPDENEGFLTKLRTKLVNGIMLAHLAQIAGVQHHIMISKQIEESNGRNNKKIMEDAFEAFIGAMFLDNDDQGYQTTETWLITLIETEIDFSELIAQNTNFKDTLLKHFQHTFNYLPKFYEISTENTQNGKVYNVCVRDKNETIIATGTGPNKKHAENDCAKNALKHYDMYSL